MKITFDRETAYFILGVFEGTFNAECIVCDREITDKNLGGVVKDGYFCSNIVCIISFSKILNEKDQV